MKTGIELISEERQRQINVEGWTAEHDDEHNSKELAIAGACYALGKEWVHIERPINSARGMEAAGYQYDYTKAGPEQITWPWDAEWWKPSKDTVRNLVKAGALIAAEIDRLQRKNPIERLKFKRKGRGRK